MKYLVLLAMATLLSACTTHESPQKYCTNTDDLTLYLAGPSITLPELEQLGKKAAFITGDLSTPFGAANPDWKRLTSAWKNGDSIREFEMRGSKAETYAGGYALSRDGCVVDAFVTWVQ